jgi:hypothetical protein
MKEANRDVLDRGSLPELLVSRARQSSDRRLAVDAAIGIVLAAVVAILRPPLWIPLTALAVCLGAYGAWGILDRELADAAAGKRALAVGRGFVAVVGAAAALLFGISLFFGLLGPIIS